VHVCEFFLSFFLSFSHHMGRGSPEEEIERKGNHVQIKEIKEKHRERADLCHRKGLKNNIKICCLYEYKK